MASPPALGREEGSWPRNAGVARLPQMSWKALEGSGQTRLGGPRAEAAGGRPILGEKL